MAPAPSELIRRLLRASEERGVRMRLAGSAAVVLRCRGMAEVDRRWSNSIKDLDLVCDRRDAVGLQGVLDEFGYIQDARLLVATEGRRWTLSASDRTHWVDVFFDRLEFCHTLDLRNRLVIDSDTLTMADLLLSKLQYVAPRPQDIGQMLDIVGTHPTGECDGDRINTRRVAQVLCQSWGYWQTAQLNFRRMEQRLLTTETADRPPAMERLAALRDQIAGSPKSIRWQVRAVLGQGLRWYSEVEDTDVF